MTAKELMARYSLDPHIENGSFTERHYESDKEGRPSSGAIYYYVGEDEKTEFHRIDCDEYWCFILGSPLEVWHTSGGKMVVSMLGTDEGCEPLLFLRKGEIFASKHRSGASDGTFLSCITVPRFRYEGFEMIGKDEMIKQFPVTKKFYE